jgi:hypothetical protein
VKAEKSLAKKYIFHADLKKATCEGREVCGANKMLFFNHAGYRLAIIRGFRVTNWP